jgi:alkylmercury lyase
MTRHEEPVENGGEGAARAPDPEVAERAQFRSFSPSYKLRVLNEYESLNKQGKGALLRREGLYSSLISEWRKQRDKGALSAFSEPRGGRRRIRWNERTSVCVGRTTTAVRSRVLTRYRGTRFTMRVMTSTKPIREELNWMREEAAASPALTDADRRLVRALTRLMVQDGPVPTARLAGALGRPREEVEEALDALPFIYHDEQGHIVGFWGLSAVETPHRLVQDGRQVYAWCAQDTLFLSIVLDILFDRPVRVESTCPTTGARIRLDVSSSGVTGVEPEGVVMSFLRPPDPAAALSGDAVTNLCHFIHFFASEEAAREWTTAHEGTFPLEIEDAWPFARETALHEWFGVDAAATDAGHAPTTGNPWT